MYEKGQGVSQDYKTAVKWYRLAAEQGNVDAQSNLKEIKVCLMSKGIDGCLFDENPKVTGPETKKIVEKYCRRKMEKKSLERLLLYAN
jgi:TPR repeat protein